MLSSSNIKTRNNEKSNNAKLIINEFKKPIFTNKFYININSLILTSNETTFKSNLWDQNPQRFALDQYGEFEYYPIVLLVNKVNSIFLFTASFFENRKILIPSSKEIVKVLTRT